MRGWQFENFGRSFLRGLDRKGLQSRQETVYLIQGNSLAAMGHQKSVANFIEPQDRNQGALFGEACKDGQAVLSIRFVFENHWSAREASRTKSFTDGGPRESTP